MTPSRLAVFVEIARSRSVMSEAEANILAVLVGIGDASFRDPNKTQTARDVRFCLIANGVTEEDFRNFTQPKP